MPILEKEVSVYPQGLLSDCHPNAEQQWFVVYTRARHEKSLARHLHSNSLSFYLPLVEKEMFIRGRRFCSQLPVFGGYLFYFGQAPDDVRRLAPYCVSAVLPVEDQLRLHEELKSIETLISAGTPMTVEGRLITGQKVRVKSGALKGLEGTILRRKSSCRLLVSVNYLQQGISVEIEDFMVELI